MLRIRRLELDRPSPSGGTSEPSLSGRDFALLVPFWLAACWALDPGLRQLDYMGGVKHLPLLLFVLAAGFALLCRQLEPKPVPIRLHTFVPALPVLGLGVWVVVGSLVQRSSSEIDNSFLNMGLTMSMAGLTIWAALVSRAPWRWIDAFVLGTGSAAFVTGCVQVAHFGQLDVLHGHEYLVVPFALYAALRFSRRWLAWSLAACFVAFAIAAKKNTAYLTVLLTIGYVFVVGVNAAWPRMDAARRGLLLLGVFAALALLATVVTFVLARRAEYLPTGNTEFRSFTYWRAWTKFLNSPVIGTGFVGPSSEYFPLYAVDSGTQILPTHSDLLDILANGGVLGLVLWLAGMAWMLRGAIRIALSRQVLQRREKALIHFAVLSALCAFLTCLFNPVLQYPNTSWTFWALFGMAALMPRLLDQKSLRSPRRPFRQPWGNLNARVVNDTLHESAR